MPNIMSLIVVWFAIIAASFVSRVSAKKTVTVPLVRRGPKLTGSVLIGKEAYDMSFGMSSDEVWLFGKDLQGQVQDSKSFTHKFYTTNPSLQNNGAEAGTFESAIFESRTRVMTSRISGVMGQENFSFKKPKFWGWGKTGTTFNKIPLGIVTKLDSSLTKTVYDYDGTFGLWPPWIDDSPESYLDFLPERKFSLYLAGNGDSGELVLGGINPRKIRNADGEEGWCIEVRRYSLPRVKGSQRRPTVVSTSATFNFGEQLLTAKKRSEPIEQVILDIEVSGLQVPRRTLQNILKKSGAKMMAVMPSISENDQVNNAAANQRDTGYFIPCGRRRNKVTEISFSLGEKRVVFTGHDQFLPSKLNPSLCKMAVNLLPKDLLEKRLIVLGDTFFKKFVTIFNFEEGTGGKASTLCIATPKEEEARPSGGPKKQEMAVLSSRRSNNTDSTISLSSNSYDDHEPSDVDDYFS